MSFPSVSQVFRSTRLYYHLLPHHHSRLPGRYTSPPVLSEDLSSEKTKRSHHRRSTWRWHGIPNVCTLCFPDVPPNPFFQSLDTWLHQRSSSAVVCASENVRKTLKPLALPLFIIFLHPQNVLCFSLRTHKASQLSQSPILFNAHPIIKRYPFYFFC